MKGCLVEPQTIDLIPNLSSEQTPFLNKTAEFLGPYSLLNQNSLLEIYLQSHDHRIRSAPPKLQTENKVQRSRQLVPLLLQRKNLISLTTRSKMVKFAKKGH